MDVRIERHDDVALAERFEGTAFRRGRCEVAHRMQLDPEGHLVARTGDGRPVGTAACVVYPGADLAWIGGMVVLPEARRNGIGRRLLHAALEHAQARHASVVGLDASEEGRPLYEAEAFRPVCLSTRWARHDAAQPPHEASYAIFPASSAELMEIAAFDRTRFGANRAPWIAAVLQGFPGRAFVAYGRRDGRLAGYVLGQDAAIGPLVADDRAAALQLLLAAEGGGAPATVDALDLNASATHVLREAGYRPTGARCLRMVRGGDLPGLVETQFAIGAWALG